MLCFYLKSKRKNDEIINYKSSKFLCKIFTHNFTETATEKFICFYFR
jgi:hypothetical protein